MEFLEEIIRSPWYRIGLIVFGISWVVFTGRWRWTRHPLWPMFGWIIVVIVIGLDVYFGRE